MASCCCRFTHPAKKQHEPQGVFHGAYPTSGEHQDRPISAGADRSAHVSRARDNWMPSRQNWPGGVMVQDGIDLTWTGKQMLGPAIESPSGEEIFFDHRDDDAGAQCNWWNRPHGAPTLSIATALSRKRTRSTTALAGTSVERSMAPVP